MTTTFKTPNPFSLITPKGAYSTPFTLLDEILNKDFSIGMPAVNIAESADKYSVELSAPGFSNENFKLEVEDGQLIVTAEIPAENKSEERTYSRREFKRGAFRKAFQLADDVNTEIITASYENGILNIAIPKKEEAKVKPAREIKVS
jgi:HSP20 family protein